MSGKSNDTVKRISDFRTKLLLKMPFYGEVLSHIDIMQSEEIETAATNGKVIFYNERFFRGLNDGELNYVLMHELFHVILLHFRRRKGRDESIWNVAADYVVNGLLDTLVRNDRRPWRHRDYGIRFIRPKEGCFLEEYRDQSVEELYRMIREDNKDNKRTFRILLLCSRYGPIRKVSEKRKLDPRDFDLIIIPDESRSEQIAESIRKITEDAAKRFSSDPSMGLIGREIKLLKHDKRLPWKKLLMRFLSAQEAEDVSYDRPERKYLHMEMILPGESDQGRKNDIKDVWAFIDTSGSISEYEMNRFMTQLYRICVQFGTRVNIGFWDTEMHEVYRNVEHKKITDCTSAHYGGTTIRAVYDYIRENRIEPKVMLILTDGYFGDIERSVAAKFKNRTILVLSTEPDEDLSYIGKIARL